MESNHNSRLRRPVYYPLYYRGKFSWYYVPELFGGEGEIRTHTRLRMKEAHNHYATSPYRNTLLPAVKRHRAMRLTKCFYMVGALRIELRLPG